MTSINDSYSVIKRPVITEKATDLSANNNTYTFRVPRDANKVAIRHAVEQIFEVKVSGVNTLNVRSEWRRRGYTKGATQAWKKAMVTLAEGQTIDVL